MYRYIIADDEIWTRAGTREKLAALSNTVQCVGEAADGNEALALIGQLHPDFIITDMKMPGLGGEYLLPILSERYPDLSIIVISGYQDFNYSLQAIRAHAVNYLVKPFSARDLVNSVQQVIQEMESRQTTAVHLEQNVRYEETLDLLNTETQLHKLLNGTALSQLEPLSANLQKINTGYGYIFCTLHSSEDMDPEAVREFFYMEETPYIYFLPHTHLLSLGYLLLNFPAHYASRDSSFYRNILQRIHHDLLKLTPSLRIGISSKALSLNQLPAACQQSIDALNQLSPFSENALSFFDEASHTAAPIVWEKTDEFLYRIETGQTDDVKLLTKELFSFFQSRRNICLKDIKHCCSLITGQMNILLQKKLDVSSGSHLSRFDTRVEDTLFSFQELQEYYLQVFTNAAALLETREQRALPDLIQSVKDYIDHNYQKDLSGEYLAHLFYVNRTYLSHNFRFKTGTSITEYLNQVRISQSKALLAKKQLKIYQIANAIGYSNVRTFYRQFKKIEGITPEVYRTNLEYPSFKA
ncbi:MAG: response regulator [Lachnospiraceae bacterium]|nr:response regulator [Lachnospiraceae bacterium]